MRFDGKGLLELSGIVKHLPLESFVLQFCRGAELFEERSFFALVASLPRLKSLTLQANEYFGMPPPLVDALALVMSSCIRPHADGSRPTNNLPNLNYLELRLDYDVPLAKLLIMACKERCPPKFELQLFLNSGGLDLYYNREIRNMAVRGMILYIDGGLV